MNGYTLLLTVGGFGFGWLLLCYLRAQRRIALFERDAAIEEELFAQERASIQRHKDALLLRERQYNVAEGGLVRRSERLKAREAELASRAQALTLREEAAEEGKRRKRERDAQSARARRQWAQNAAAREQQA